VLGVGELDEPRQQRARIVGRRLGQPSLSVPRSLLRCFGLLPSSRPLLVPVQPLLLHALCLPAAMVEAPSF